MEIMIAIDNVADKILSGDFRLEDTMPTLVDSLLELAPTLSMEKNKEFVVILQKMMEAQSNQDYLLVADILEYELKKFLRSTEKELATSSYKN